MYGIEDQHINPLQCLVAAKKRIIHAAFFRKDEGRKWLLINWRLVRLWSHWISNDVRSAGKTMYTKKDKRD